MVGTAPSSGNCVAYFPFDTNANDSSGNGNNGTVSGATLTTGDGGIIDEAYDFDGVNDYVEVVASGTSTGIINDAIGDFSCSIWMDLDNTSSRQFAISNRTNDGDFAIGFRADNATSVYNARLFNGSSYIAVNSSISSTGYHNIVLTYDDSASEAKIYVDAVLENTVSVSLSASASQNHLTIGSFDNSSTLPVNGRLDEPCFFDTVLTADNVTYIYQSGSPTTEQQYPFSAPGTPAFDALFFGVGF